MNKGSASSHAWLVVAVLWVVACLNYLDRMMITTMRGSLMEAVPMSEAQFGLLTSAFLWVYGALSPFAGFLADRIGRDRVIVGSLFVWSAVTWLTGRAETFDQRLAARALMGISEACYIPAALALIADVHRGATRSLATGIHMTGIFVGLALGGLGGVLVGGAWADRWSRTNRRGPILVPALGLCIAAPGILMAASANWLPVAILGLILYGFTRAFGDANRMPILCLVSDRCYRATGYGVLNFLSSLIGGLAVFAGGALRDNNVNLSYMFLFVAFSLLCCMLLLVRPTDNEPSHVDLAATVES